MSKRRKIGDIVTVRAGSGFWSGGPTRCVIPDTEGNRDPPPCMMCDDSACAEWSEVFGNPDAPTSDQIMLCHVSECQMQDDEPIPE